MSNPQETKTSKKSRKFSFKGKLRRKGKKETEQRMFPSTKDDNDDNSSVYSLNLDASSKVSASHSALESATAPIGDPIHIILLIIDPKTRRFELLQLEFDSATAKVSHIFPQIAVSLTEPSLKLQTYEILMNIKGDELVPSKNLVEYFDSAGIVISVPSTTMESGDVIAKMANWILSKPRVHDMVSIIVCMYNSFGIQDMKKN
jgi:hypothetical protein